MVTKPYFTQHTSAAEQRLFDDLSVESIKVAGINVYYMPRKYGALDPIFNEDTSSVYDEAFLIDVYVKNTEGFGGQGDIIGMAGLEIWDTLSIVVAMRTWKQDIGVKVDKPRPMEGDLVYLPLNRKIFKVMFVEHESVFYQGGDLYVWELRLELFSYGGETIDTGIPEIDDVVDGAGGTLDYGIMLEDEGFILEEIEGIPLQLEDFTGDDAFGAMNDVFQDEGNTLINWDCVDPFVRYPTGKW